VEPLQENSANNSLSLSPAQVYQILLSADSTQDQIFAAVQASRYAYGNLMFAVLHFLHFAFYA
jgi:hypothetical protein